MHFQRVHRIEAHTFTRRHHVCQQSIRRFFIFSTFWHPPSTLPNQIHLRLEHLWIECSFDTDLLFMNGKWQPCDRDVTSEKGFSWILWYRLFFSAMEDAVLARNNVDGWGQNKFIVLWQQCHFQFLSNPRQHSYVGIEYYRLILGMLWPWLDSFHGITMATTLPQQNSQTEFVDNRRSEKIIMNAVLWNVASRPWQTEFQFNESTHLRQIVVANKRNP